MASFVLSASLLGTASAQTATTTEILPIPPTHISPTNGTTLAQSSLTRVDWSDVIGTNTPITYVYESSNSINTQTDGSFVTPLYTSGTLVTSEIPVTGTGIGTYYWHVRAVDSKGNKSSWSTPTVFSVIQNQSTSTTTSTTTTSTSTDTFAPLAPREISVKKSIVSGSPTQVWSWSPARDWNWVNTSSGINRYEYSINSNSTTTAATYTSVGNIRTLTTKLTAGTYTIQIRAVDNAGNVGAVASKTITILAPFASGTAPTSEQNCKKDGWTLYTSPNFTSEKACKQYVKDTLKQNKTKSHGREHRENESEHGSQGHKNGRDD